MITFLFQVLVFLLIAGLLIYLIRWAVTAFGLPQPIVVILSVIILIAFLFFCWQYLPGSAGVGHPPQHITR